MQINKTCINPWYKWSLKTGDNSLTWSSFSKNLHMGPVTILYMIPKARAPAWKGNIFKSELIAAMSLLSVLCSSANDSKKFKYITLPFELFQLLLTCCILLKVMGHQPSDQNEQGPFTKTESCSSAQRVLQENEVHKKIIN